MNMSTAKIEKNVKYFGTAVLTITLLALIVNSIVNPVPFVF